MGQDGTREDTRSFSSRYHEINAAANFLVKYLNAVFISSLKISLCYLPPVMAQMVTGHGSRHVPGHPFVDQDVVLARAVLCCSGGRGISVERQGKCRSPLPSPLCQGMWG